MSTNIDKNIEGNALRLAPNVDLAASSVEILRTEMMDAIDEEHESVVLDLSAIEQVDSLGITLVVGLFKTCKGKDLGFSVEGANPNLLRVFSLFKLNKHFPVKGA